MTHESVQIFVIGAGAMAEAFIRGVTRNSVIAPENIWVKNRSRTDRVEHLQESYGIRPANSWGNIANSSLVILAVKPADAQGVIQQASPFLKGQPIVSFAAGISVEQLEAYAGGLAPGVRTMPNLPVSVSAGTTAVTFGNGVSRQDRELILHLLGQLGDTLEVAEDMMDAVTAFSGSGPGFICYILEAMESAAINMGFTAEAARQTLLRTLTGTVRTLEQWKLSPQELRQRVTSPGGTTFAGVEVLEKANVQETIGKAIFAAKERSSELGKVLRQTRS